MIPRDRPSPHARPSAPRDALPGSAAFSTLAAMLLAAAVILPALGHRPLTNWDEGIYAEVSREMLSGRWLVPAWNQQLWLEKPPLMLWVTAAFFKTFGVHAFWARAGSAFSGIAAVGVLHGWLERREGRMPAWIATVILLATFGFLHVCGAGEMDALLALGCTVSLCGLSGVEEKRASGWYLFWGGFAVAAMTKGAASVVLPLTLVVTALTNRWRGFNRDFGAALLLFLAAVLPWHLLMWHRFGQRFAAEYLGYHVIARAAQPLEGHVTHAWFFLWVLLVSAPPFVLLFPQAIRSALRRRALRPWALFPLLVVAFYSLVRTRLPHYIAPAYPALAAVTAIFLAGRLRTLQARTDLRPAVFWTRVGLAGLAVYGGAAALTNHGRRELHSARMGSGDGAAAAAAAGNDRAAIALLQQARTRTDAIAGPLLLWRDGRSGSIAAIVFYAQRPALRVELNPEPPAGRYDGEVRPFVQAVVDAPRLILLDKTLLPQLPAWAGLTPLAQDDTMEVAAIRRIQ